MKNYYSILNVSTNATDVQIKTAYRTLAKRYHPDVNPGNNEVARKFADINEAYDVLSDEQKRTQYNAQLQNTFRRPVGSFADVHTQTRVLTQMQEQIQAQVQTQVQAQLTGVRDRAYQNGYERGYKDGEILTKRAAAVNAEKEKQKLSETRKSCRELEQELFERDRALAQVNERLTDSENQLQWFRRVIGGNNEHMRNYLQDQTEDAENRVQALLQKISRLQQDPFATENMPSTQYEKQKQFKAQIISLNKHIADLTEKLTVWENELELQKKSEQSKHSLSSVKEKAEAWSKKLNADRRLAKPTYYGTLGVLIWATPQEIDKQFNAMEQLFGDKKDAKSVEKMESIKSAYAVLIDPERRRDYNKLIGITEERIRKERMLAAENEHIQEEYRKKVAAREFWQYFDELSSLALSGDADAQNALGELYINGQYVEQDYTQAVYWFREAFLQKHPAAMYRLALCYAGGNGVHRNKSIGAALLRQSANLGYKPAIDAMAEK